MWFITYHNNLQVLIVCYIHAFSSAYLYVIFFAGILKNFCTVPYIIYILCQLIKIIYMNIHHIQIYVKKKL